MLRIVTGRAGSGKTTEVFRRMKTEGETRPQLLLVPEQASFETERRFCQENGNRGGLYGEVLSFTRLENRVLSMAGGGAQTVLDEGGRLLVMYAALKAVSGSLTVYAMPSRKPEFLSSLLTTMDELKSCCVTGAHLAQVGEETEGLDGAKKQAWQTALPATFPTWSLVAISFQDVLQQLWHSNPTTKRLSFLLY